jgi:hypothetical protein
MLLGQIHRANIYTRDARGRYNVLTKANLVCRRSHIPRTMAGSSQGRAELSSIRHLQWSDISYQIPTASQVEIDGVRYNPVGETFGTIPSPSGGATPIGRRCDLVRAP